MEIHARWVKILKDIWDYKSRSLLVIFSIAIGVAAVGMITNSAYIIKRDLYDQHSTGNPSHIQIYTSPFDEELISAVEGMREIDNAEARRSTAALIYIQDGEWEDIILDVIPDFADIQINQIRLESGLAIPATREVLLERQSASALGVSVGDEITIEMPDERQYSLAVAGIVHDLYLMPYNIQGEVNAYLSMETLNWLGESSYYNRIEIVIAGDDISKAQALNVGALARDRVIEPSGYTVGRILVPGRGVDPGQHWGQTSMEGFLLILQVMGALSIFLSGSLVVNTITAILVQQVRQIGIMRSVGAIKSQIIGMYIANLMVFSILGLMVALPLGTLGAWWLSNFAANFVNFDTTGFIPPIHLILLQVGLGFFMPLAVALYPIIAGTRISIYEAIYQHGLTSEDKRGLVDAILNRLRSVSPPMMLSLRNTFRNQARLSFTLLTLILAGAMFMASFSTRTSLNRQIVEAAQYADFDVSLNVPDTNKSTVEREAMRIPGIAIAETWGRSTGFITRDDGSDGEEFSIVGLPIDSKTLDPVLLSGRWLQEGDIDQVVLNDDLIAERPEIQVGQMVTVKVGEREHDYEIVGITSKHLSEGRVYMTYESYGKLTGRQNKVDLLRIRGRADRLGSSDEQKQIASQLQERFENAGLSQSTARTQYNFFTSLIEVFDIILVVLIVMAGILAVVGSLGLTGTMGINILERTREIGVLRAVGASNNSVRQVVVVEGVLVGMLSWVLAALLSVPFSWALSRAVISAVLQTEAVYAYSFQGLLLWLGIVLIIGVLSSLAPAGRAVRLTVREVLDYE